MSDYSHAGKWRTRDGRILEIREMGTRHLQNSVRMLDRILDQLDRTLLEASAYQAVDAAEMASYYASHQADEACVLMGYWMAKKRELEDELRKRP